MNSKNKLSDNNQLTNRIYKCTVSKVLFQLEKEYQPVIIKLINIWKRSSKKWLVEIMFKKSQLKTKLKKARKQLKEEGRNEEPSSRVFYVCAKSWWPSIVARHIFQLQLSAIFFFILLSGAFFSKHKKMGDFLKRKTWDFRWREKNVTWFDGTEKGGRGGNELFILIVRFHSIQFNDDDVWDIVQGKG